MFDNSYTLPLGTEVQGRYKTQKVLGQGGFGVVYLAEDMRLYKSIALKQSIPADESQVKQFAFEGRVLAQLQHQGLPDVFDIFIESDSMFMAMEYVEGLSLDEWMQAKGRTFTAAEAIHVMSQVCTTVAYLHTRKPNPIVHRDIKPPNIRITSNNKAVLVDFGLSKVHEAGKKTVRGAQGYSPHFSPPEQYGAGTNARSDVYALGATMYFLLSGEVPPEALTDRLATGMPVKPILSFCADLPVDVANMIHTALELDPRKRLASANKMAAVLRNSQNVQAAPRSVSTLLCASCGTANRQSSRFCRRCGTKFYAAVGNQNKSIGLSNLEPEMLFEIGKKYAQLDQHTKAIAAFEMCLKKNAHDAAVYFQLGLAHMDNKDLNAAIRVFDAGASKHPKDEDLLEMLGHCLKELKQHKKAVSVLKKAIQLNKNALLANYDLGCIYLFELDRPKDAIQYLKRSADKITSTEQPCLVCALCYAHLGDTRSARKYVKKALGINPNSADAKELLKRL